jgi:hypothetical protein
MAISLKELRKRMVPASAKDGSAIDDQYLPPASYDKKARKAFHLDIDDADTSADQEKYNKDSDNFTAQNLVSKHKGAPLSEAEFRSVSEAYEEESLDLLEEVSILIEDANGDRVFNWRDIAGCLRSTRDTILNSAPMSIGESVDYDTLDEAFSVGTLKLRDGSKVKLKKEDVTYLNAAVAGTKDSTKMVHEITANSTDFNHFLIFARNLDENLETVADLMLEDYPEAELLAIAESGELDISEIYDYIRNGIEVGSAYGGRIGRGVGSAGGAVAGAVAGAAAGVAVYGPGGITKGANIGGMVGTAGGVAAGAAVGAVGGAAAGIAREAATLIKNPALMDKIKRWNNNKDRDSTPNKASIRRRISAQLKETDEDLQEVSKETLNKYLDKAVTDHGMANMGRKSTEGIEGQSAANNFWKRREANRKKGISTAIDKLDEDESFKGKTYVITNNARNIRGTLASKVGDIVDVKYDNRTTYRMKVLEMRNDGKITVELAGKTN